MKWVRNEEGTVLLWTLGILVVASSVLISLLSLGSYIITKRNLEAMADNASLAAVASLSLQEFIDSGDVTTITLNKTKANSRINQIITDSHSRARVEKALLGDDQVTVQLGIEWTDITGQVTRHISAISTANFTPEIDERISP